MVDGKTVHVLDLPSGLVILEQSLAGVPQGQEIIDYIVGREAYIQELLKKGRIR
jgi:hypothetical protein